MPTMTMPIPTTAAATMAAIAQNSTSSNPRQNVSLPSANTSSSVNSRRMNGQNHGGRLPSSPFPAKGSSGLPFGFVLVTDTGLRLMLLLLAGVEEAGHRLATRRRRTVAARAGAGGVVDAGRARAVVGIRAHIAARDGQVVRHREHVVVGSQVDKGPARLLAFGDALAQVRTRPLAAA